MKNHNAANGEKRKIDGDHFSNKSFDEHKIPMNMNSQGSHLEEALLNKMFNDNLMEKAPKGKSERKRNEALKSSQRYMNID